MGPELEKGRQMAREMERERMLEGRNEGHGRGVEKPGLACGEQTMEEGER